MNTTSECNTSSWAPFVGIAITVLNIAISLGKQYLNNGKHLSMADTIKEIRKELLPNKGIELNIPENLKASIPPEEKQEK